jgi:NAD+ synthase
MFDLPKLDVIATERSIENFIKEYVEKNKKDGVAVGISGGLDSACVAYLSAKALGPEKVLGVLMPEVEKLLQTDYCNTQGQDFIDANYIKSKLGISDKFRPIDKIVKSFEESLNIFDETKEKIELANIKARTRMAILHHHAHKENKLVVGTGDRSEFLTGYFTKYGDGGVDFSPIENLYKTHVRDLSREIGVPEGIIKKPSSPGLWKGQTAEDELGIKYETLDKILYNLVDKGLSIDKIDYDRKTVEYVDSLIKKSDHKRKMPPIAEVIFCEA